MNINYNVNSIDQIQKMQIEIMFDKLINYIFYISFYL